MKHWMTNIKVLCLNVMLRFVFNVMVRRTQRNE